MNTQQLQEDLVKLYLRLNGYFTTGLVIHSQDYGKNLTEVDSLAVRFPFHNQDDRDIQCSSYLQIPTDRIDIIIAEVKGGKEKIKHNTALIENKEAIKKVAKWIGVFDKDELNDIVDNLFEIFKPSDINTPENFKSLDIDSKSGKYVIRPIVFSMDRLKPKPNQSRYVYGQLMLDYIWLCLRPEEIRDTCSTIYNLNMWGHSLLPLIKYFKDENKKEVGNMNDLYKHFKLNN